MAVVTVFNYALAVLGLREANLVMVYMLAVVFVAARFGRGPAIWASVAAVLAFDFFFVPPFLTFAVADTQYFVTFVVMLVVAVLISGLTSRLLQQSRLSRQREQRTESLYHLSRELGATTGRQQLLTVAQRRLMDIFGPEVTIFLPDESRRLKPMVGADTSFANDVNELAVAQWVFEHNRMAGAGTETLPNARASYLPLATPGGAAGAIGIRTEHVDQLFAPAQRQLLFTFAGQIALALERDWLSEQAHKILSQMPGEVRAPAGDRSPGDPRPTPMRGGIA
jgi:two-component system sensor histidine kinase KdpD